VSERHFVGLVNGVPDYACSVGVGLCAAETDREARADVRRHLEAVQNFHGGRVQVKLERWQVCERCGSGGKLATVNKDGFCAPCAEALGSEAE
jgi:hypothetical protein